MILGRLVIYRLSTSPPLKVNVQRRLVYPSLKCRQSSR
jgi:hypothetical protein